tara:strand:- start:33 stop:212 length:180 start_codon:yes stop_codon:yes gene_type:complete
MAGLMERHSSRQIEIRRIGLSGLGRAASAILHDREMGENGKGGKCIPPRRKARSMKRDE